MKAGARVVEDNWRDVTIVIERNIKGGVRKVLLEFERQVKANITTLGLVDTGNYRRSWVFSLDDDGFGAEAASDEKATAIRHGRVHSAKRGRSVLASAVEYGPYLEYGTRNMAARPHIVPAATTIAKRITEYFDRLDRR